MRIWKILKEVLRYYEESNAEIIGLLDRQIVISFGCGDNAYFVRHRLEFRFYGAWIHHPILDPLIVQAGSTLQVETIACG